jgi:hypothetical protein
MNFNYLTIQWRLWVIKGKIILDETQAFGVSNKIQRTPTRREQRNSNVGLPPTLSVDNSLIVVGSETLLQDIEFEDIGCESIVLMEE